MGGFFGAVSQRDVTLDIFFGVDYHSHLGTRRGGMVVYGPETGFVREIHDIENTPFRTKFERDLADFHGCSGIGCISDTDPQPLLVRSHLGLYAISTVGIINNADELIQTYFSDHGHQFMAMSSGRVNATELAAALATAKEMGYERVIAVHQPFTYSRTKALMDDFAAVLRQADQCVLLPIMGSREVDDGSVKSEDLAAKIPGSIVVDGLESAANWVKQNAREGDLVVCMSCGDLYKACDMMVGKA